MAKSKRLGYLGLGIETVLGTPVLPTITIPSNSVVPEDDVPPIFDESIRNNNARVQNILPGAASTKFVQKAHPYPDTFGHLLRALGFVDTVSAGTAGDAGKSLHALALNNLQPPSYTATHADGNSVRTYPGCMLSQLSLDVDVSAAAEYTTNWVGYPGAPGSAYSPVYSAADPFLGWQLTATVGGTATTKLRTCSMVFDRDAETIPGSNGTQSPRETFADGLDFTFKYTALFDLDVDRDRFISYLEHAVVLSLVQPSAPGHRLVVTATRSKDVDFQVGSDGKYLTCDVSGRSSFSTTDGGAVKVLLVNGQSAAY